MLAPDETVCVDNNGCAGGKCSGGACNVFEYEIDGNDGLADVVERTPRIVASLAALADGLAGEVARSARPGWRDALARRGALLQAAAWGLMTGGGAAALRIHWMNLPALWNWRPAAGLTAVLGLAILAGITAWAARWLGPSASRHLVLLTWLSVGGFGCFAATFGIIREINVGMDESPAARLDAEVLGAREMHSKYGTRYCATIAGPERAMPPLELDWDESA